MELQNTFEVPLPPSEAWEVLLDIERIAPCLPGARLTEVVDDRTFKGEVSVRLGPVALTFAGKVTLEVIDGVEYSARVKAQGADAKGRGGADAVVEFSLEPIDGGTRVLIRTDLRLSGSIAQYGRGVGMIQDVSTQLIGEFSRALRAQLAETAIPAAERRGEAPAGPLPAAKPISGFALMFRVLWNAILRLFRRRS
ncbi:MAG: SRPBCC family protein [Proteobacteria bacterium]|nr:SRPBCC family protein [Pseudomonadota bacterium]